MSYSHVLELDRQMQHVDMILSIGWKGGEPTFLERLAAAARGRRPRFLAVNRTSKSRDELHQRLDAIGMSVDREGGMERDNDDAFSEFTASGRVVEFLD